MSPDQARSAIYLDFEGYKGHPPALLGWAGGWSDRTVVSDVVQTVLVPTYELAASHSRLRLADLEVVIGELVTRARDERRLLVSYSSTELSVVQTYTRSDLADAFGASYFNALPFATRWVNALHSDWRFPVPRAKGKSRYPLQRFLAFMDFELPRGAGSGLTTKRLRGVAAGLRRGASWERLTRVQKVYWGDLLVHNAFDVLGLRAMCLRASDELVARKAPERGATVRARR